MAKPREYFKFNFSKVVKFDCTCGRRYINTDKCLQETDSRMPQTNADKIRAMSDAELADYLDNNFCHRYCCCERENQATLDWLRSEAEE